MKAFYHGVPFLAEKSDHGLHAVGEEWFEMDVIVDSGACETVMPVEAAKHSRIHESPGSKAGQEYEAANGQPMDNVGERRCLVSAEGADDKRLMHFREVYKIKKPLRSVTSIAGMGYECLLGKNGGFVLGTRSGDRLPIQRRGDLCILKVWIKDSTPGFGRPE